MRTTLTPAERAVAIARLQRQLQKAPAPSRNERREIIRNAERRDRRTRRAAARTLVEERRAARQAGKQQ